jgi:hypothetical protein
LRFKLLQAQQVNALPTHTTQNAAITRSMFRISMAVLVKVLH